MKFISLGVWIVCALLLMAALDTLPDPPALNPNATACKVLQSHVYPCDSAPQPCDSCFSADPVSLSTLYLDTYEYARPADPTTILTERAADSSPPRIGA